MLFRLYNEIQHFATKVCNLLPVYSLAESETRLQSNDPILYFGRIHASHVKGFSKAGKRFTVCAVELCDTGTQCAEVRKTTAISADIPLFTLQGGKIAKNSDEWIA